MKAKDLNKKEDHSFSQEAIRKVMSSKRKLKKSSLSLSQKKVIPPPQAAVLKKRFKSTGTANWELLLKKMKKENGLKRKKKTLIREDEKKEKKEKTEETRNTKKKLRENGTTEVKAKVKSHKAYELNKRKQKEIEAEEASKIEAAYKENPSSMPCLQYLQQSKGEERVHHGPTHELALDCEMVGVGPRGFVSILARVSVVNSFGECIYDTFVKPTRKVTDYRTWVSGVRKEDVEDAPMFLVVQRKMKELLTGRVLVGHSIENDLKAMDLEHPITDIRDTSHFRPFVELNDGKTPSLKKLSEKVLKSQIQSGEHSSVTDAKATMGLYILYKREWERDIKEHHEYFQQRMGHKLEKNMENRKEALDKARYKCLKYLENTSGVDFNHSGPEAGAIAMSCASVHDIDGMEHVVRVSLVNQHGQCIYDQVIKPREKVTDLGDTGLTASQLTYGVDFKQCQTVVSDVTKGRILIAHKAKETLKLLYLDHPGKKVRDPAIYPPFKGVTYGREPSMQALAIRVLRVDVADFNTVTKAKLCMALYQLNRVNWEKPSSERSKDVQKLAIGGYVMDKLPKKNQDKSGKKKTTFKGKKRSRGKGEADDGVPSKKRKTSNASKGQNGTENSNKASKLSELNEKQKQTRGASNEDEGSNGIDDDKALANNSASTESLSSGEGTSVKRSEKLKNETDTKKKSKRAKLKKCGKISSKELSTIPAVRVDSSTKESLKTNNPAVSVGSTAEKDHRSASKSSTVKLNKICSSSTEQDTKKSKSSKSGVVSAKSSVTNEEVTEPGNAKPRSTKRKRNRKKKSSTTTS